MIKPEQWDMGHKSAYKHYKHVYSASIRNLTRKEFLNEYNNPNHYRPELPSSNRKHILELPKDIYYGP